MQYLSAVESNFNLLLKSLYSYILKLSMDIFRNIIKVLVFKSANILPVSVPYNTLQFVRSVEYFMRLFVFLNFNSSISIEQCGL